MSLASRLLLRAGLRWTAVAAGAAILLMLLVDWVEHGSRLPGSGGAAMSASLRMALLLLPGHLSMATPVVAALGAALAVVSLRRNGEWQALGGAGLGPARLLAPFAVLGLLAGLGGAALDSWAVPISARAYDRAMAQQLDRPLRLEGAVWLELDSVAFRLEGDPAGGRLSPASAFSAGQPLEAWTRAELSWDGRTWQAAEATPGAPWARLPAPEALAELCGSDDPGSYRWAALLEDSRPAAQAERLDRGSRPLAAPLAALIAAALCALLAPGSLAVLLAATPVLAWELATTVLHGQVALGHAPAASVPALRLGLALLIAVAVLWRLRRP